jgi:WD40 repeat protein
MGFGDINKGVHMFCPSCGEKNDDGNRFCGKCGKPLPVNTIAVPVTPPVPVQSPQRTGKRLSGWRLALVIIGSLLFLLILLVVAGLAFGWIHITRVSTETVSPVSNTPYLTTANYQHIASHKFPTYGAVSPQADLYASNNGSDVELYSIPEFNLLRTIQGNGSDVAWVAFSPDGHLLATVDADQTVKVWKASNGTLLQTFPVNASEEAPFVEFVDDDRVAYLGYFARSMFMWKVSDGSLQLDLSGGLTRSGNEIFSPDGNLMAEWSSFDQAAYILNLSTGNWLDNYYADYDSSVTCGAFSPDSQLLATGSHDSTVQIWNIPEQKQIAALTLDEIVKAVRFSKDGNTLYAINKFGNAWIWQWKENQSITATSPEGEYQALGVSNHEKWLAVGSLVGQIPLIDTTSGNILQTLKIEGDETTISTILFSPDDKLLISSSAFGFISVWQNMP